jgi:hypothetical protein
MNRYRSIMASCLFTFALSSPLGALGDIPGHRSATNSSSWSLSDNRLDFLAGASLFKGETGIALAVRGPLVNDFRWEVGGILPHQVSGYASDGAVSVAPPSTESASLRVRSFGEAHVVALYPLFEKPRSSGTPGWTLDAGAGISLAFVDNVIDQQVTNGQFSSANSYPTNKARIGPRLQLGVAAALTDRISVRLDIAWVDYANRDSFGAHNFNLNFSGFLINPMLQVRL